MNRMHTHSLTAMFANHGTRRDHDLAGNKMSAMASMAIGSGGSGCLDEGTAGNHGGVAASTGG